MKIIDNITDILKDDLSVVMKENSKVAIAASYFSIYAFQELKSQLLNINELRFIFTSPSFTTEKAKKEKREFYIPQLNREKSLYGTEFEIKLRNELTQKAIAKEKERLESLVISLENKIKNEKQYNFQVKMAGELRKVKKQLRSN